MITDWGNHHFDIAHWGMGCDLGGPISVEARGLFPNKGRADCYTTPDRFFCRMMYPNDVEALFFSSIKERWSGQKPEDFVETSPAELDWLFGADAPDEIRAYNRNGILFIGEEGRIFVNRGGVHGKAVESLKEEPLPSDAWRVYASDDHIANFFDCMKTRKQPCTPVQVGHRTTTACHLTNISLRLNRKLTWDAEKEVIVGDVEANAWLSRQQRPPYGIIW
jgi:myo-inositol 2-dehydrogenase / D-chiro-inositol 1-dehydrogenase